MSTNDAVSREAVKEAIETWWQEKKWHSRWLRRLFRAIDQLPPLQPDGPGRSREEICQAIDDYLKKNPSWGPSGDLWISRRALSEVVAKLFAEGKEEKTDEAR